MIIMVGDTQYTFNAGSVFYWEGVKYKVQSTELHKAENSDELYTLIKVTNITSNS